jgi:hypothetical protein
VVWSCWVLFAGLGWVWGPGVVVGLSWLWNGFRALADPRGTCMFSDWLSGVALMPWGFGMFLVGMVGLCWVWAMVVVLVLDCGWVFVLFCLVYL